VESMTAHPFVARLNRLTGLAPGLALAAAAALTGVLRRDKPLHPAGHHGTGRLTLSTSVPDLGVPALAAGGTRPCVVRWSRAMGLPRGWPDIEGLALRLPGASQHGDDADLLLASTGEHRWSRYLLTLRRPRRFGRLTTLLPVRAGGRALTFALDPVTGGADGLPPTSYVLEVARGKGPWQRLGQLDVAWSEGDTTDRFDPVARPLDGVEQYAFVEALREPAYVAARAVARARPTTEKRPHA
jgi:hypothetical protein